MSESLRDRVARVLNNEGAFCGNCGREPGDPIDHCDDCNQVLSRYVDALIAAGLVTEPRGRVRDSEVLDRMGDRVGPKDYPLANLIYDAASRMRRNENEQEATS